MKFEELKYYIPSLDDIRIGYECEVYEQSTDKLIPQREWYKAVISWGQITRKTIAITNCKRLIKENHLRTQFLTKEQIEAEGWKGEKPGIFNKGENLLMWWDWLNRIEIDTGGCENGYGGECRCINDFRLICKLLKI